MCLDEVMVKTKKDEERLSERGTYIVILFSLGNLKTVKNIIRASRGAYLSHGPAKVVCLNLINDQLLGGEMFNVKYRPKMFGSYVKKKVILPKEYPKWCKNEKRKFNYQTLLDIG